MALTRAKPTEAAMAREAGHGVGRLRPIAPSQGVIVTEQDDVDVDVDVDEIF